MVDDDDVVPADVVEPGVAQPAAAGVRSHRSPAMRSAARTCPAALRQSGPVPTTVTLPSCVLELQLGEQREPAAPLVGGAGDADLAAEPAVGEHDAERVPAGRSRAVTS